MVKLKLITALILGLFVLPSLAMAQQTFVVKPLVEKKVMAAAVWRLVLEHR